MNLIKMSNQPVLRFLQATASERVVAQPRGEAVPCGESGGPRRAPLITSMARVPQSPRVECQVRRWTADTSCGAPAWLAVVRWPQCSCDKAVGQMAANLLKIFMHVSSY